MAETNGVLITAVVALGASLIASILGPLIDKWWIEPRALRRQKERNCFEVFVSSIDGVYSNDFCPAKIEKALCQYRMAWLYADDQVVRSMNRLLQSMRNPIPPLEPDTPEYALGSTMLAMRQMAFGRTQLSASDFLLTSATSKRAAEETAPQQ